MPVPLWPLLVMWLTASILAIQPHDRPSGALTEAHAAAWAAAAASYGAAVGEDPYELVGVARHETDFEENSVSADGKDCGLTQTRTTGSHYGCAALCRDYRLAFREAARELAETRKSCRYARDFDRCRLNRYKSGVRYARTGEPGRYWLRIRCFAAAARAVVDPGNACRTIRTEEEMERALREAPPVSVRMAVGGGAANQTVYGGLMR